MKNFLISIKFTLAMCLLLGAGYVLVLRGVSAVAGPNGGEAEMVELDGKVVGAAHVGQAFAGNIYFRGRPSVVDYNGGGSGGSNKGTTNPEYLAEVEQRIADFLAAHPYLTREEVPSEMVTASGSGLDPDISPRGAQVQVRRVAEARGLEASVVESLVDSLTRGPWLGLFGTPKVNVLALNVALERIQPKESIPARIEPLGTNGGDRPKSDAPAGGKAVEPAEKEQ